MPQRFWHGAKNKQKIDKVSILCVHKGVPSGKEVVRVEFYSKEINMRGMKLVKDGGYLATCSCSHFMDEELFLKTIADAARDAHKRLRQVEFRQQAADHPILWGGAASYYLKFVIFQVCDEI